MPLYEYVCRDCGDRFETMRRVEERLSVATCPSCGGEHTSLAMSAPGFVGAGAAMMAGDSCAARPDGGCCGGACLN